MFQVITIFGFDEPWWFFDDWKTHIQETVEFDSMDDAVVFFEKQADTFTAKFSHQKSKRQFLTAFWDDKQLDYCADCGDDLQLYQGLMIVKDGKEIAPKKES
ncbi:DUF1033 family protein [Dellaglioa algida]|uniref:DUF1033 family protein n=1 Tax=Dellaglioa algida TaxID=105612 RepID=UPI0024C48059|nr:DUF1033 family protein [Dellaglioa algida]MDK1728726.1 DUF1033 family protein [Dellaglioa algida]MDK1736285.1 DUF1033 family protein [Dellaglioa algida]MDK1738019.1 DUF1033 family protein [Dellaglioa algida]